MGGVGYQSVALPDVYQGFFEGTCIVEQCQARFDDTVQPFCLRFSTLFWNPLATGVLFAGTPYMCVCSVRREPRGTPCVSCWAL